MARITINLETKLARAAKQKAAADRRSVSSYLLKLIEADMADTGHIRHAAAELRTLGADPVMALRDKIAEVQRDQFLSTSTNETKNQPPAPPVISESQLCHSPAASRVLASRATARPAFRVG